jgi:hypothetical protein
MWEGYELDMQELQDDPDMRRALIEATTCDEFLSDHIKIIPVGFEEK